MDSLTQIALGSAVGYAVLGNKVGRKAVAWGAVLGTLPDLDVLIPYESAVAAFTYHRSFSHSLLVHLLITPLIVWLILKIHKGTQAYRQGWFWLVFLSLSTHAILDSFTVYGTQLLWPITEYPFGVSNLFIIDPLVTLPLLVGIGFVLMPKIDRHRAYRMNTIGLILCGVYITWSLAAKVYINSKVTDALVARQIESVNFISTPAPFTTLLWRIVVMSGDHYYEGYASLFDLSTEVSFDRYPTNPKLLENLESEWGVQRLNWFTKGFNAVRLKQTDIVMSDLRMGVECAYVFNFKVAKRTGNDIQIGTFEKFSQRPDLSDLPYLWDRIWEPEVILAPEPSELAQC